jgi:dihydroxyacetone kinase
MTALFDDPAAFAEDMPEGFADANANYVVRVPGGVVRSSRTRPGKVAVVVGGGSGHYPAFCGVVGGGFADGAVVGNVFTSPSTADAVSVGRHANGGAGVLFITGNYAGDVMNFERAVEELAAERVPARYLVVTDDVASAPESERTKRRGIAGDFTVFKVASAAAEAGYEFDDVVRVATAANDFTRTLGVAFAGCTLPGAAGPLFTVDAGRMGVGLGIHGEPGIADADLPTAAELAELLVKRLLAEVPSSAGDKVAVILNGLGRTKYEELFVVWRTVSRLLRDSGLTLIEPEVGELVTSLDMAGCSLTITWLDDELERLWCAPADTPAYRKGALVREANDIARSRPELNTTALGSETTVAVPPADETSRAGAAVAVAALRQMADAFENAAPRLGEIDAVAGDGDHGRGMVRGTNAALAAADAAAAAGAGLGTVLSAAGAAWAADAGGTSGALWGAALQAAGTQLGDHGQPSSSDVVAVVGTTYAAIARLGNARRGDKTMLDALGPFGESLAEAVSRGESVADAWALAAGTATEEAAATAQLRPKVGRARPLAERSVGTPDAGAVSMALCLEAVGEVLLAAAHPRTTSGDGHE